MPDFECPINPERFGSNPFGLIGPQFITLQIVGRAPFFSTIDRLHCCEVLNRAIQCFRFSWPDVAFSSFKVMGTENIYLSYCQYN